MHFATCKVHCGKKSCKVNHFRFRFWNPFCLSKDFLQKRGFFFVFKITNSSLVIFHSAGCGTCLSSCLKLSNRCTSCHDCHRFNIICLICHNFIPSPFSLESWLTTKKTSSLFGQIHFLQYKRPSLLSSQYMNVGGWRGFKKRTLGVHFYAIVEYLVRWED